MFIAAVDRKLAQIKGLLLQPEMVRNWILFSLFFHVLAVIFSLGYHQHDEHWQILEFANMKAGKVAVEVLPWEYQLKMRSGLQPWMAYHIFQFLSLFGVKSPYLLTFFLRLLSGILAFGMSLWLPFSQLKRLTTELSQKTALILTSLIWFFPYQHVRFASENWAGMFFWAAFILLTERPDAGHSRVKKGGILVAAAAFLAFSFLFRFAAGFMIGGLLMWIFLFEPKRKIESIVIGVLVVFFILGVGLLVDYWLYGTWTISGWNFLYEDIIQKKLGWGTSIPWYFYLAQLSLALVPPYSVLLLVLSFGFFVIYPRRAFTWAALPFILVHTYIWHKEFRYLAPLLFCFPVVVAYSVLYLQEKYSAFFQKLQVHAAAKFFFKGFIIINMIAAFIASVKPANDKIYFFRAVAQKYSQEKTFLFSYKTDFYKEAHLVISFYHPENIKEIRIDSPKRLTQRIDKQLQTTGTALLGFYGFEWPPELDALKEKCVVTINSIPDWLRDYNYFNWQSRTRIWNIAECKRD